MRYGDAVLRIVVCVLWIIIIERLHISDKLSLVCVLNRIFFRKLVIFSVLCMIDVMYSKFGIFSYIGLTDISLFSVVYNINYIIAH